MSHRPKARPSVDYRPVGEERWRAPTAAGRRARSRVKPWTLAIDFGTTSTVTVIGVEGERPHVLEVGGDRRMPSIVYIDDDGSVLVGHVAAGLALSDPRRGIRGLKSRLGHPTPIVLAGEAHRAVDLVAEVLAFSLAEATRHQGSAPTQTRLTYPATWSRPRRSELLEAAAKAGLPEPTLIAEPVAAALTYGETVGIPDGSHVAVFDLGGGTFDTAVLLRSGENFKVIGKPTGDPELGGELFDEIIMNEVGERLEGEWWDSLMTSDDMQWRQAAGRLRAECKRVKEAVSSHPYGELVIGTPDGLSQQRLTRDEVEALLEPHVDEAIELLQRCVSDAAVPASALSAIFVAGGASRMPMIERKLREAYPGIALGLQGDPKAAVAYGALVASPGTLDVGLGAGSTAVTKPLAAPLPPRAPANSSADRSAPTAQPLSPLAAAAQPTIPPTPSPAAPSPAAPSPAMPFAPPASAPTVPPTPQAPGHHSPATVVGAPAQAPGAPASPVSAPTDQGSSPNRGPILAALAGVTALVALAIGFVVLNGGDEPANGPTEDTEQTSTETGESDTTSDSQPDETETETPETSDAITVGADGEFQSLPDAIAAAPAGATLMLAGETFTVPNTIEVSQAITIIGAGPDSTIITSDGQMDRAVMRFNSSEVTLSELSVTYGGTSPTNILEFDNATIDLLAVTVSGARFDANNPSFSASGNGIAAIGTTSGTMESIIATDNEIGIGLHDRTSVDVSLSVTSDNRDHGFGFFDTTSSTATSNTSSSNGISGFAMFNTASPSLIGNTSSENEGPGFVYFDASAGIARDNTAEANMSNGFELQSTASPNLTANEASANAADGFRWVGESGGLASGNEASDNLSDGFVTVGTASPQLNANLATGNTVDGFAFAESSTPIVISNTANDNTEAGFSWLSNAAGTASENTAMGNVIAGFYVGGTSSPTLTDNTADTNPGTGFLWTNEATGRAEGNEAKGNTLNGFEVQGTAAPNLINNQSNNNTGLGFGWFQKAGGTGSMNSTSGNESSPSFVDPGASPELSDNTFDE